VFEEPAEWARIRFPQERVRTFDWGHYNLRPLTIPARAYGDTDRRLRLPHHRAECDRGADPSKGHAGDHEEYEVWLRAPA
jgi:hypothetical protein